MVIILKGVDYMEEQGINERWKQNCGTQIKDCFVVIFCGEVDVNTKDFERTLQEGNLMGHNKNKCEQEGCRIEIKDSKVVILCGEVDFDKVKECITETFMK